MVVGFIGLDMLDSTLAKISIKLPAKYYKKMANFVVPRGVN